MCKINTFSHLIYIFYIFKYRNRSQKRINIYLHWNRYCIFSESIYTFTLKSLAGEGPYIITYLHNLHISYFSRTFMSTYVRILESIAGEGGGEQPISYFQILIQLHDIYIYNICYTIHIYIYIYIYTYATTTTTNNHNKVIIIVNIIIYIYIHIHTHVTYYFICLCMLYISNTCILF